MHTHRNDDITPYVSKPVVLSSNCADAEMGDVFLRFRLFYEGKFYSAKDDNVRDRRTKHKHELRRYFHHQLKDLWCERKFLREIETSGEIFGCPGERRLLSDKLVELSPDINGYKFVPLVHERLGLTCAINVLLMRRDRPGDRPGRAFTPRDIDNRLKVLFDALKMPSDVTELGSDQPLADGSDNPMFVLLQKDELIDKVTLETDDLLNPPDDAKDDDSYARVLIDVQIGLWDVNTFNLSFA